MIHTNDRAGYIGASDTKYVMRDNHTTKSWIEWWETKLGSGHRSFSENKYTRAGNLYEHPILDAIDPEIIKDGQIIIEDKLLRVNYDGWKDGIIYEVKTHRADKEFKPSEYNGQCQVEMYVYQECAERWFLPPFRELRIVSYPLYADEYEALEPVVDPNRINDEIIPYDPKFVKKYLKKLEKLTKALKAGDFPG